MAGLLDRLTGGILYTLVSLGLTPVRWPWRPCGTVILEVKGRRSGQIRSTLVTWAEHAGERHLVVMPASEPQWVKNMRNDGGHVSLRHGRHRTDIVLREVPPDQRPAILQVWCGTTSMSSNPRRHFGMAPDAPIQEFERLAATHAVFRCERSPTTSTTGIRALTGGAVSEDLREP